MSVMKDYAKKDYTNAYNELPTTREIVIEVVGGVFSLVMLAGFLFGLLLIGGVQ